VKAEKLHITDNPLRSPTNVFILIRVFSIRDNPGIAIFVDPWRLHLNGQLVLKTFAHYLVSLDSGSPGIYLQESIQEPQSRKFGRFRGVILNRDSNRIQGSYSYAPLKNAGEFRLLELEVGEGEIPLRGTIRHYSMNHQNQYKAISYV
jgi:hypothetical protein